MTERADSHQPNAEPTTEPLTAVIGSGTVADDIRSVGGHDRGEIAAELDLVERPSGRPLGNPGATCQGTAGQIADPDAAQSDNTVVG